VDFRLDPGGSKGADGLFEVVHRRSLRTLAARAEPFIPLLSPRAGSSPESALLRSGVTG